MNSKIPERAKALFPDNIDLQRAYIQGCQDIINEASGINPDFLTELATRLRKMWPPGEKDGKWPWRESVSALTERLTFLWKERQFKDKYTMEQCLAAARRYLAQYETNAKYMQILKYFVCKQTKIYGKDGKCSYITKSSFADMLESGGYDVTDEWAEIFESDSTIGMQQGELV